jgi:hypothetical protein
MQLHIALSPQLAAKLRQLSIQQLRPVGLQAEFLLIKAIKEACCTSESALDLETHEVGHAQTEP